MWWILIFVWFLIRSVDRMLKFENLSEVKCFWGKFIIWIDLDFRYKRLNRWNVRIILMLRVNVYERGKRWEYIYIVFLLMGSVIKIVFNGRFIDLEVKCWYI